MNYMQIQRTGDDPKVPCDIVQMFTDADMFALASFLTDKSGLNTNDNEEERKEKAVVGTLIHLLQQWENKTQ